MIDDVFLPTISRSRARDLGIRDADIGRLLAGEWSRLRQGDYWLSSPPERPEDAHRQLVLASAARQPATSRAVVSHGSAAVLHRLPTWDLDLVRVHVTYPDSPGSSSSGSIRPHRGRLTDGEMTMVDDVRTTSVARTVLDIARFDGIQRAVVVADAALAGGLVTREELLDVVAIATARKTAGPAVYVAEFADARSESVGESRSRVMLARLGLPDPELQIEHRDDAGHLIGRVDFDFPAFRTIGEFDGSAKYGANVGDVDAGGVVLQEKRREDALRDLGCEVVRWGWSDLARPQLVLRRFTRAFTRAGIADWTPGPARLPTGRR